MEEDSTPGTVKPVPVSLVEPVAYPMQLMDRRELEGVLAHELLDVGNHETG